VYKYDILVEAVSLMHEEYGHVDVFTTGEHPPLCTPFVFLCKAELKGTNMANNVIVFNHLIHLNADVSSVDARENHGAMIAAGAANSIIWSEFVRRAVEFKERGLDWDHLNQDKRNVSGVCCHLSGPKTIYKDCIHLHNTKILTLLQDRYSAPASSSNRRTTHGNEPGSSKYVRDLKLGNRSAIDGSRIGWYAGAWQAAAHGGGGGWYADAWQASSHGGGGDTVCWRCQGSGHHAWACTS